MKMLRRFVFAAVFPIALAASAVASSTPALFSSVAPVTLQLKAPFKELIETGRDGPTVLVIGDSFTRGFWQDYFGLHAGKYIWMHHELCGFAVSVVERYAPDVVILAPAERQMFCFGK